MRNIYLLFSFLMIITNALAQENIAVIYDSEFDFKTLKTFCFSQDSKKLKDELNADAPIGLVLVNEINNVGGKMVEDEAEADAIIDINLGFKNMINVQEQEMTIYSRYYGGSRFKERYLGADDISEIEDIEARLVINILDIKSDSTVWTAVLKGEPDFEDDPAKIKERMVKNLKEVFQKYPN